MNVPNLFSDVRADATEELMQTLLQNDQVRIERIVSTGQASPDGFWYDQPENEWVLVLKGKASLQFDNLHGETIAMDPGAHVYIPAHRKHRVVSTSSSEPTVWLAVFCR